MSGRPLRFLIATLAGWTGVRMVMLWPSSEAATAPRDAIGFAEPPRSNTESPSRAADRLVQAAFASTAPMRSRSAWRPTSPTAVSTKPALAIAPLTMTVMPSTTNSRATAEPQQLAPFAQPLPGRLVVPHRWSGSAWLALRGGNGSGSGLGGQLGGSQAGIRIAYAIDPARRLAVMGRLTSPTRGTGREAAIGIEWQPTRLPIRFVVERRFALDGGRGGPAAGIVAGTGPAPLALGTELESYGQAGVVRRDRAEPFADGALRITHRLLPIGPATIDIGLGAWGGAQREAQRLDVGPTIGIRLPVGGRSLRALLDWRRRIAGDARPGSGPALTIGTDF